jgi:hypothetical protein
MRKGYIAWNYRKADTAGLDELPEDFADYVPSPARYGERIAAGDTPVEAALKELMATNAFGEREIETYKKLLAGWEYAEATGLIVRTHGQKKPPPQPPPMTHVGEFVESGCLREALWFVELMALMAAGVLALAAGWPWLARVGPLVASWVAGHAAEVIAALVVAANVAFRLSSWSDGRGRR